MALKVFLLKAHLFLQLQCLQGTEDSSILGYGTSISINVILCEAKETAVRGIRLCIEDSD